MANDLISREPTNDKPSLYERDFYTWAVRQARALKEHRLEDLDWENLSDEVGAWQKLITRPVSRLPAGSCAAA
jgi:hypothetical protein